MTLAIEPQGDGDISLTWLAALRAVHEGLAHETTGLAVRIQSSDGALREIPDIRAALDRSLAAAARTGSGNPKKPALVDTVASTIFPASLWNPDVPRESLYERYRRILPIVRNFQENRHGTYFSRFLDHENQLEHVITTRLDRHNNRRSAYQLIVFNPEADHGDWRQRGFPCLHQVSFVPNTQRKTLEVFGYYPTQTIFEKAYGNYLGLWRLGEFVAHQWELTMKSVTCVAVVAKSAAKQPSLRIAGRLLNELRGF